MNTTEFVEQNKTADSALVSKYVSNINFPVIINCQHQKFG